MNNNLHPPHIQSFAATDKGRRPNNEDFVTSFEPTDQKERQLSGCIYIVADGVGGASIGERASKFAAEKVLYEYLQKPDIEPVIRLKRAIVNANREIYEYAEQNGIRMATTMTVAVILGSKLIAANVGDSRIYLIRAGEARQITYDHNVVGELVRRGAMTEAEALKSKAKNKLTRSIGGSDEVQAETFEVQLQPADKVLLCSDGLTRYALKEDIVKITEGNSPKQIVTDAIEFAKKKGHGGADNISVITVVYEPADAISDKRPELMVPEEEWEIRETEIGFENQKSRPVLQWIIIAMLLFGFVAVLGGAAYLLRNQLFSFAQLLSSTPSPTLFVQATAALPSPTLPPTATETLPPSPTLTFTAEATGTATPESIAIQTFTNITDSETSAPTSLINCLYTVVSGDTLFDIAVKFKIGGNNYKNIFCATTADNTCDIQYPQLISPGWLVIIPGTDQEVCINNSGTPQ